MNSTRHTRFHSFQPVPTSEIEANSLRPCSSEERALNDNAIRSESPTIGRVAPLELALIPSDTPPPAAYVHPFSRRERLLTVSVFTLMASLIFADQNLLAPNLSTAAAFFGFNDVQKDQLLGGYISAAFFAVGAPSAMLVGWYADRVSRRNLLFAVAMIGQVPSLLTIFVTQFWQFFVIRIFTGVSVGGCFPLLYSLLGDFFPPEHRTTTSAYITIATGAGVGIGQMVSGWIGPATDWRLPFTIVAAPAILVAFVMLFITRDPPRGACEEALQGQMAEGGHAYSEKVSWAKVKRLLRSPSNWIIILQGIPGSLPWGMFFTFFNDYLQIQNGFSPGTATLIITIFGLGSALGVVGGGILSQWLYNRKKEWMPALAGTCVLIGIAPTMFLVNVQLSSLLGLAFFMSFTAGMFSAVASPVIKSVLLNVNEPEVRGVAGALQTITDDLGKALGPFIVAGFISVLGRTNAFNIAVCGWFLCGFMILSLVLCMRRDEERMQERLMMTAGRNDLQEEEEEEVQEEGARALHRMEEGGGEQFSSNKRPESPDDSSTPMPHGAFESLDSPHPSQLPGMVERESQGIAPGVHPPTSKDAF